jgi:hypothetical protein
MRFLRIFIKLSKIGNSDDKNCGSIDIAACDGSSNTKLNLPDGNFFAVISLNPRIHKNAANAKSAVS